MKDHLIFDTLDAETKNSTDSVGAYIRSGDSGALVSHHSSIKPSAGSFDFVDGDVTVGTDQINEAAHGFNTGDLVQLTSSGTLPAGLALATDYYVIRVDANNIKLAASAKDAEDGNAVDITAAAGGGTHTVTGQEQNVRALDVYMVNDINVNLTQADEITVYQGTNPWVIGDGGGSITVDGTVAATQSGTWTIDSITNDVSIDDGGNSITVDDGGVSLTVDGTVAATQSGTWTVGLSEDHNYGAVGANTLRTAAQIGNATGAADFGAGATTAQTLRVSLASDAGDSALANTAIANAVNGMSVANTAEDVVASPLSNRKYLYIYNNGNKQAYIGASGVTSSNGFPLSPGSYLELRAGASVDIEWVASDTSQEIRTLELS